MRLGQGGFNGGGILSEVRAEDAIGSTRLQLGFISSIIHNQNWTNRER
jgi:hypothetical protein